MAVADAPAKETQVDELYQWPYRFEILPLDVLEVDDRYQRPLTNFWKTVSEGFNPALVGTLIVSERRNGNKHIIDGQTRWMAMKDRGLPGAPCLIYEGLTMQQEARLFADLQTQRRGMRTYDRFRAQLVAKEPLAVGISRVVQEQGFDLSATETSYTMRAIAALERAYRVDPEHLADVLTVIRNVWGVENRDAVSAQIIAGLSSFLRTQERLDYDRLEKRLRDVTPKLIQNQASQIREGAGYGTGAAKSVSQAILNLYLRKR
jgi:uncharacterized coiled-coil protein SlyX